MLLYTKAALALSEDGKSLTGVRSGLLHTETTGGDPAAQAGQRHRERLRGQNSVWITTNCQTPSQRVTLADLIDSLGVDQNNDFLDVASYLLSQGIPITVHNFVYAVKKKSYAFLQLS